MFLLVLGMNEFVQPAQVCIQALTLPRQASGSHVRQDHEPLSQHMQICQTSPGGELPGVSQEVSQEIQEPRVLPLHQRCCFQDRWSIECIFTRRDTLQAIRSYLLGRLRNKQTARMGRAAKPTEAKRSLSLPLFWLCVKPKANKPQLCLKTQQTFSSTLPL